MHLRLKIFPYKMGSQSAKALATTLRVKRVRPSYDARRRDIIINWGNSRPAGFIGSVNDLNTHAGIALACNKLLTFKTLSDQGFQYLPEWTTDYAEAENKIANGETLYCRQTLTGHSGHGIIVADSLDKLVRAPLYTVKTKHKYEFRVHVFKGSVIDIQQKRRRLDYTGPDTGIRNHSNGYIYARATVDYPNHLLTASIEAVNLLGLDFGAVDIGYRERDNKVFVFEVNTAPGLTGTTLDKYVQAFKGYLNAN